MAAKRRHVMTPARKAALRKAQLASARKRRGTGKSRGRQKYVVRYHHTQAAEGRSIKRHGLVTGATKGFVSPPGTRVRRKQGQVFLTSRNRKSFFKIGVRTNEHQRGKSGQHVAIKVKIPAHIYHKHSRIDPNHIPGTTRHPATLYISPKEKLSVIHEKHLTKAGGTRYSHAGLSSKRRAARYALQRRSPVLHVKQASYQRRLRSNARANQRALHRVTPPKAITGRKIKR